MIQVKNEYPGAQHQTYLNTAASGLMSKKATEKVQEFHSNYLEKGTVHADAWLMNDFPKVRETIAEFIDASIEQLAIIPNFSFGYNSLLDSIGKKKTLVYERDYPSLKIPLELKGFELVELQDTLGFAIDQNELFKILVQENIELLVMSHAQFKTGFLADIQAIGTFCKKNNIIFIVDATQTAGAIPMSFSNLNVGALIWSNYKWINGGFATGVMCLKPHMITDHVPRIGGFGSFVIEGDNWIYRPSSKSYEPSHPNMAALLGLQVALEEKMEIGINSIRSHNKELLEYCTQGLIAKGVDFYGKDSPTSERAFIVMPAEEEVFQKLKSRNIITTFRENYIRFGFHFYNSKEDVDAFLEEF